MSNLKWKHKDAIEAYEIVVKEYGKPTAVGVDEGGFAIWDRKKLKDTCFEEMICRDESVIHNCPSLHRDFLYTYIKVKVKPNQIDMLYSISGSITYDPLKNLLSARCGSNEANIATLKLATDLLLGNDVNYKDKNIKYKNLKDVHGTGAYGATINATIDPDFVKILYDGLCKNVKKLSKNLNDGYWSKAFSNNCGEPKQKGGNVNININYKDKYIDYKNKYLELAMTFMNKNIGW